MQSAPPDISAQIVNQYTAIGATWIGISLGYANRLFWGLALIDFAWFGVQAMLQHNELQGWMAALVRKVVGIGAFYALLLNPDWIRAIILSFQQIGQEGMKLPNLSAGAVLEAGWNLSGSMMDQALQKAYFLKFGTSLACIIAGFVVLIAFCLIALNYIMALVEAHILITCGLIFLGFGGSRWTAPYVERYIALAVGNGVRVMLMYFLIGVGMSLVSGWQQIADTAGNIKDLMALVSAAFIFSGLCWHIPKLFGAMLGGAPALTGGDLVGTSTAIAGGGVASLYMATTMLSNAVAKMTQAISGGSASGGAAAAAGSGYSASPSTTPTHVSPPSSSGGGDAGRYAAARINPPSDHAAPPNTPRMPIDGHE